MSICGPMRLAAIPTALVAARSAANQAFLEDPVHPRARRKTKRTQNDPARSVGTRAAHSGRPGTAEKSAA